MKRTILSYNPGLKEYAKFLRRNATLAEVLLWKRLKARQVCGLDFDRQRPIGHYVVDFYCKDLMLAVEVDGRSHDDKREEDAERQKFLEQMGVSFLRFWDHDVKNDLGRVVGEIEEWVKKNRPTPGPSKEGNGGRPTPCPSREGNGGRPTPCPSREGNGEPTPGPSKEGNCRRRFVLHPFPFFGDRGELFPLTT